MKRRTLDENYSVILLAMAERGGRRTPMKIKEGDEVRSILDGKDYVITRIVGKKVILKSRNGEREIITGMDSLRIFYREKEDSKS